MILSHWHN